jgi:hypothetical protein
MRKVLFLAVVLAFCSIARAQDQNWKLKGVFGATYNQTDVTDNWSGPEKDAISWGLKLDAQAEKVSERADWVNTFQEQYGKTKTGSGPEEISADLLRFESVYNILTTGYLSPFVSGRIETQNTNIFNPAIYSEAAGVGRQLIKKEKENLKTRVGIAFRQTLDSVHTRIDPVTLAVVQFSAADDPNTPEIETSLYETGAEWVTNYDILLHENLKFVSEAQVFDAFDGAANLRWDNSLYVSLSKYVTMQLQYLVIYPWSKNAKPVWPQDVQKRLTLTVGLAYNIF